MKTNYRVQEVRNQCSNCKFVVADWYANDDFACDEDRVYVDNRNYEAYDSWCKIHDVDENGICDDYQER